MGLSIDLEKIIAAMEWCRENPCKGCPYEQNEDAEGRCTISDDTIALLKEQGAEAKWIYGEDKTGVDGWYCSECNFFEPWFYEYTADIDFIRFYGHCPSCGRKMTSYIGKPTQTGGRSVNECNGL